MPTYEYGCKACGHRFEEFQSMSDDPIKICPECGEESVERLMSSGAGLIFKGTGFYITDYKNKNGSGGNNGRKGSSKSSESNTKSDASSSESKKTNTESD